MSAPDCIVPANYRPDLILNGSPGGHSTSGLLRPARWLSLPAYQMAAAVVCLLGVSVLLGWALDVPSLKKVFPRFVSMKANTALCFLLSGLALGLTPVAETSVSPTRRWLRTLLLAVVALTSLLTLSEYVIPWNPGIDELLVADLEHHGTAYPPGRFAPATATNFLLLTIALAALNIYPRLSRLCTILPGLTALVGLLGYLYDLSSLYSTWSPASLALHTTIGFLVLCFGVVAARPGPLLCDAGTTGAWVRPLLIGAILLPVSLGWLAFAGSRVGWYGSEMALALFTVSLVLTTATLVWATGWEHLALSEERQRAEAALRASEQQFRTLADSIPQLAWIVEPDGRTSWFNQRWYDYTGASQGQPEEQGWQNVLAPAMLPDVLEHWRACLSTGTPFDKVLSLRGKDGVFRLFLTRIMPVRDAQDSIVRWFGTSTDIDEQQRVEQALRRANAELEQFAYAASHDLQEPLRQVNIYTQLLLRESGQGGKESTEFAGYIESGVHRMRTLITGLLSYSRTLHQEAPVMQSADVSKSLQQALQTVAQRVQETQALITVDTALPVVAGNEQQLAQVFQNLLLNALTYCPTGQPPCIHVAAEQCGNEWIISVRDQGIGFQPEYATRIFGLFKRLHRDQYPGTGLGLALCQRIVERYQGRIWAESDGEGCGAAFFFTLPCRQ